MRCGGAYATPCVARGYKASQPFRLAVPWHVPPSARLVDDGFRMPEFDYGTLARVSERPKGSGTQALVYAATIPTGTRAGEAVALKVLRPNLAGVESERRAVEKTSN